MPKAKHILIVDDEASFTRLLKMNLEHTGQFVVRVENHPKDALAAAEEFNPDLIFLDVMMPGMDGGDLAASFQASPKWKNIPIVFLTAAVSRREVAARTGYIGGLPFLAKPVDFDEVIACIKQRLGS